MKQSKWELESKGIRGKRSFGLLARNEAYFVGKQQVQNFYKIYIILQNESKNTLNYGKEIVWVVSHWIVAWQFCGC